MVKPLGIFTGRRKSSSNVLEEIMADPAPRSPEGHSAANADSGGFRLMSRAEVDQANVRRKTMEREKSTSKFPRFSGFGTAKSGRIQSFEEESPGSASSKRDSNETRFSASRPYNNNQYGSTSTLPSSNDSSDDNLFAGAHRHYASQHTGSPSSMNMNSIRKQLPSIPKPKDKAGRDRSMTASSYASTAIPPKLEADLNFGNSSFEDMFSDMNRKEPSREPAAGRSLLAEKRTFQAEPIRINPKLDVEPPLKSWESRGSAENLMSPRSDNDSPPPPPPTHKFSQYTPVATGSPTLASSSFEFQDNDAQIIRKSFVDRQSYRDSSPEQNPKSFASSSAASLQTPASSRSSNHTTNTTPKASLAPTPSTHAEDEDDNMFAPAQAAPKTAQTPVRNAPALAVVEATPAATASSASKNANGRVMTQTEYLEMQRRATTQPPPEDDSEEEDYEDEEDAIKRREEEEIMRRKRQQMHFAREAMRRTTTAPANLSHDDGADNFGMGFPSETSMKADEWEDEDVPLGILAQHGFPSQSRNRPPNQPANAIPSYIPDRPASAGALMNGARAGHLPAFARNLPADPHSSFIGGGLVLPSTRESMGFNGYARGPASIAGDSVAGGMGMGTPPPMMYHDAGMSQPSLVDQIQMRDMAKPKYMGGSSNKKPQGGPFTGMLGQHMNASSQAQNSTRMPQMPAMNGMNGMNPMMNPMMGGQMPMMGMGMNQMGYPMPQGNDMMAMQQFQQMQQMIAMQQMQLQQMQAMQQPQSQDPRGAMGMAPSVYGGNMMGNGSFLNVPGAMTNGMGNMQNRPMSFMSVNGGHQQPPMSNYLGTGPGYTPSIAPSERSNIGMSARYRPVANNSDARSTGTSMTLQASGGVAQGQSAPIKGIIKRVPQAQADEDEDWSKMAARKNRLNAGNKQRSNGLADLTKGLNI